MKDNFKIIRSSNNPFRPTSKINGGVVLQSMKSKPKHRCMKRCTTINNHRSGFLKSLCDEYLSCLQVVKPCAVCGVKDFFWWNIYGALNMTIYGARYSTFKFLKLIIGDLKKHGYKTNLRRLSVDEIKSFMIKIS